MAINVLETIWRGELAQTSDDNALDPDRAETLSILDAAERHHALQKLLEAEMARDRSAAVEDVVEAVRKEQEQ